MIKKTDKPETKKAPAPQGASKESAPQGTTKTESKKSAVKNAAKSRVGFFIWSFAVLAIVGGALVVSWPLWRAPALEYARAHAPGFVVDLFETKPSQDFAVVTLPSEPATESAPASLAPMTPPEPDARLSALERALGDMANEVAGLSAGTGNGAGDGAALEKLASKITSLEARLKEMEKKLAASDGATGIRLLLLGQVQGALGRGQPFIDTLDALKKVMVDDADGLALLARLAVHGETGVPTRRRLIDDFEVTARTIARAIRRDAFSESVGEGEAGKDGGLSVPGWLAGLWGKVSSLVVVRRVTIAPETDTSADALLARAGGALSAGDLSGAVIALDGLGREAAGAASSWLTGAEARLDADKTFQALQAHILAAERG